MATLSNSEQPVVANDTNNTTTTSNNNPSAPSSPVKTTTTTQQEQQQQPVAAAAAVEEKPQQQPTAAPEENSPQPNRQTEQQQTTEEQQPQKRAENGGAAPGVVAAAEEKKKASTSSSPTKPKSQPKAASNSAGRASSQDQGSQQRNQQQQQEETPSRKSHALSEQQLADRFGKMSASERVIEGEKILRKRMSEKYGKGSANFRSHTERTSLTNGPRKSEAPTPQSMKARELDEERRQAAAKKFHLDERTLTSKDQPWTIADPGAIGNKKVAVPKWKRPSGARDEIQAGRRIPVKYNAPGPGTYYDPLGWLGGLK